MKFKRFEEPMNSYFWAIIGDMLYIGSPVIIKNLPKPYLNCFKQHEKCFIFQEDGTMILSKLGIEIAAEYAKEELALIK